MPAKKTTAKKTTGKTARKTTRKRRGPAEARGPEPGQSAIATDDAEIGELVAKIRGARGAVIGAYHDPYGGTPLVFASLPGGAVEATSFQRDLSRTHAERLATAIGDTGAFLDPVIAIPAKEGFLSPNGRHRIAAARQLGQRSITVLATADPALAYRILALNTEKAHNLRDRSLEVIRMARSLAKEQPRSKETDHATAFESPAFLTLGCAYEKRDRFSGSSYNSMLRRVEVFSERTLPVSLREREGSAARLLEIDAQVKKVIAALQARGFKSPYLRNYVVARINPVRFHKVKKGDTQPPMPLAQALMRMAASAKSFKLESVSNSDLAWVAVGAGAQSE